MYDFFEPLSTTYNEIFFSLRGVDCSILAWDGTGDCTVSEGRPTYASLLESGLIEPTTKTINFWISIKFEIFD